MSGCCHEYLLEVVPVPTAPPSQRGTTGFRLVIALRGLRYEQRRARRAWRRSLQAYARLIAEAKKGAEAPNA